MTILGFFLLLVIGAVCGVVAEIIVGYGPGGFLLAGGVGIVGSLIGGWLARALGLPTVLAIRIDGFVLDFVWAIVGAVLLLLLVRALRGGVATRHRP